MIHCHSDRKVPEFAIAAILVTAGTDVLYLFIMCGQNVNSLTIPRIQFQSLYLLAIIAAIMIVALVSVALLRFALLGAATVGLFGNGVMAIFSIGSLLLIASMLTAITLVQVLEEHNGGLGALAVTALGGMVGIATLMVFPYIPIR